MFSSSRNRVWFQRDVDRHLDGESSTLTLLGTHLDGEVTILTLYVPNWLPLFCYSAVRQVLPFSGTNDGILWPNLSQCSLVFWGGRANTKFRRVFRYRGLRGTEYNVRPSALFLIANCSITKKNPPVVCVSSGKRFRID